MREPLIRPRSGGAGWAPPGLIRRSPLRRISRVAWRRPGPWLGLAALLIASAVAAGEIPAWPPCVDVTLEGDGLAGAPPLTATWEISNGLTLPGNPAVLDTGLLAAGAYTAHLELDNGFGSAQSPPIPFTVASLSPGAGPLYANLGGLAVAFEALAPGATEFRWTWGDGTRSGWLTGCDGNQPTHTYPSAGLYLARLEVRNCREPAQLGPAFAVVALHSASIAIFADGFEAGNASSWSQSNP